MQSDDRKGDPTAAARAAVMVLCAYFRERRLSPGSSSHPVFDRAKTVFPWIRMPTAEPDELETAIVQRLRVAYHAPGPGLRLVSSKDLATELNVELDRVWQALHRLRQTGLVARIAFGGWTFTGFTDDLIAERKGR